MTQPNPFQKNSRHGDEIPPTRDWSEYTFALLYCCYGWDTPWTIRPFIIQIGAISQGKTVKIVDAEMSLLMGRSRNYISKLRAKLCDWQDSANCSLVKVTEHKFDFRTKTCKPTEYQFMIAALLDQIVWTARRSPIYGRDWREAIRQAVADMADGVGTTPVWKHRKKRREPSADRVAEILWLQWWRASNRALTHRHRQGGSIAALRQDMILELEGIEKQVI